MAGRRSAPGWLAWRRWHSGLASSSPGGSSRTTGSNRGGLMLLQFFQWTNDLAFSVAYRESLWYFPVTQAFHLVALAFFAGAILVVDMRLLGAGLNKLPVAQVARDAQPWFVGSFVVMTITGIPQFMSNAMRYYDN